MCYGLRDPQFASRFMKQFKVFAIGTIPLIQKGQMQLVLFHLLNMKTFKRRPYVSFEKRCAVNCY